MKWSQQCCNIYIASKKLTLLTATDHRVWNRDQFCEMFILLYSFKQL
jgi:hypothetical protein